MRPVKILHTPARGVILSAHELRTVTTLGKGQKKETKVKTETETVMKTKKEKKMMAM